MLEKSYKGKRHFVLEQSQPALDTGREILKITGQLKAFYTVSACVGTNLNSMGFDNIYGSTLRPPSVLR